MTIKGGLRGSHLLALGCLLASSAQALPARACNLSGQDCIGEVNSADTGGGLKAGGLDAYGAWTFDEGTGAGTVASSQSGPAVVGVTGIGTDPLSHIPVGALVGVWGDGTQVSGGTGVYGYGTIGVVGSAYGTSTGADGVYGSSTNGVGVYALSGNGYGVYAQSTNSYGIYATSANGDAIYGQAGSSGIAMVASGGGTALQAITSNVNGTGVDGEDNSSGGVGVYGGGASYGVYGSSDGTAVAGVSTSGLGVYGQTGSASANAGSFTNTASGGIALVATSTAGYGLHAISSSTGSAIIGTNWTAGGFAGNFEGNILVQATPYAYQTSFSIWSDERLKKDIKPLQGALDTVLRFRGVTFEWKDPERAAHQAGTQTGFIAQDVEKVRPDWVTVGPDGYKTVNVSGLNAMLVESVRELKFQNDELRVRVQSLEAGRRPLVSGMGEGGIGLGLCAIAGAILASRRKRSED